MTEQAVQGRVLPIERQVEVDVQVQRAAEALDQVGGDRPVDDGVAVVVSTGRCNTSMKNVRRCVKAERLARPLIELQGYFVQVRLRVA